MLVLTLKDRVIENSNIEVHGVRMTSHFISYFNR